MLEFRSLTGDKMFRMLMLNIVLIKDLVESVFAYIDEKKEVTDIVGYQHQRLLSPEEYNWKDFTADLVVELKTGELVNIEMYGSVFGEEEYIKSFCYALRLFQSTIPEGGTYSDAKTVYSINFVNGPYPCSDELVNNYGIINTKTYKMPNNKLIVFIIIRLDLIRKMKYTDSRLVLWLRMLTSRSIAEQESLGKEDDIMELVSDRAKRLYANGFFITAEEEREYELRVARKRVKEEMEEKFQKESQKMEKNFEKQSEEEKEKIAIKLLNEGLTTDAISRVTGLDLYVVNALKTKN